MKKRTSVVWSIPKEELESIVKNNNSLSKVLIYFGLYNKGGNIKTLKRRLDEDSIDYSHIALGTNSNKGRKIPKTSIALEKVMIENSTYSRGTLKKRLLEEGILENKCSECGQEEEWQGKHLVMILDHINGVGNDHREENLRMLCPNCNSQQETFAGRNNKKKKYYCEKCGEERCFKHSKICRICASKEKRKVKDRPSKEQLLNEIKELGYCGTGRKYGVSDNAIRKWLKK